MKTRTSIAIDKDVRQAAQALAKKRGVSLSRLVSEVLEEHLEKERGRGRRLTALERRFPRSVVFRTTPPGLPLAADHERLAFRD